MTDDINLLPPGAENDAVDIQRIDMWVRKLGEAQEMRARVREVLQQRMNGLDSQIAYATQQIEDMARVWRGATELPEIPLVAGTVKVRQRPPTVTAGDAELMRVAKARGLEGDGEFVAPAKPKRAPLLKLLKYGRPDNLGTQTAFDPDTGEEFPGIYKVKAAEGAWSVSIKPGKIEPMEEEGDA